MESCTLTVKKLKKTPAKSVANCDSFRVIPTKTTLWPLFPASSAISSHPSCLQLSQRPERSSHSAPEMLMCSSKLVEIFGHRNLQMDAAKFQSCVPSNLHGFVPVRAINCEIQLSWVLIYIPYQISSGTSFHQYLYVRMPMCHSFMAQNDRETLHESHDMSDVVTTAGGGRFFFTRDIAWPGSFIKIGWSYMCLIYSCQGLLKFVVYFPRNLLPKALSLTITYSST